MTVREFENGYWYFDELKDFAWRYFAALRLRVNRLLPTV